MYKVLVSMSEEEYIVVMQISDAELKTRISELNSVGLSSIVSERTMRLRKQKLWNKCRLDSVSLFKKKIF